MKQAELKKIIAVTQAQKLTETALKYCKISLKNYKKDDPIEFQKVFGELKIGALKLQFKRKALIFENALLDYPYIETTIEIFKKQRNRFYLIGSYRLITKLNGEIADDYLEIN